MGSETRRVPPNWHNHHPETDKGTLQPMFDCTIEQAQADWDRQEIAFFAHKAIDPTYAEGCAALEDWANQRPGRNVVSSQGETGYEPRWYRPWRDDEATWWQRWENVTEGTPISPAFETLEALAEYLLENDSDYDDFEDADELCEAMHQGMVRRKTLRTGAEIEEGDYRDKLREMTPEVQILKAAEAKTVETVRQRFDKLMDEAVKARKK